jgi:hypothetical protein
MDNYHLYDNIYYQSIIENLLIGITDNRLVIDIIINRQFTHVHLMLIMFHLLLSNNPII